MNGAGSSDLRSEIGELGDTNAGIMLSGANGTRE